VLKGAVRPTEGADWLGFADLCRRWKRLYTASARFYTEAFAARPELHADPEKFHRYGAACAAALAAAGKGADAAKLARNERARLRQQALKWLRADLALWAKRSGGAPADKGPPVRQILEHWQRDADLASLRDDTALAGLPEAERAAWRRLWADVAALVSKARG